VLSCRYCHLLHLVNLYSNLKLTLTFLTIISLTHVLTLSLFLSLSPFYLTFQARNCLLFLCCCIFAAATAAGTLIQMHMAGLQAILVQLPAIVHSLAFLTDL